MNKYRIKIKGKNPTDFLRYLIAKKIKLYDINEDKNEVRVTVLEEDYEKIMKFKTSYQITIINHFGLLKIKYLIEKYKYILLFICLAIIIIIFLSKFIFNIEVVHQKEEVRELIYNDLKEFGLQKYRFKVSYEKKEEIKNKILEKEKDRIEWLEIDNIGTKYIVNVEERLINSKEESNKPRDIVAKKDAMILQIEASSGEIVKKKYDYVKKGETLISGTIKNKDTEVSKVKAKGKVFGEVWYKVQVSLPTIYHEQTRTGVTKKALTLRIINKKISIPSGNKNKSYAIEDKILIANKLLPIKLVIEEKHELKIINKKFNLNNCSSEAIKIATSSLMTKLKNNSTVLDKKVLKKTMNNSTIIVDVFFKVQEDITDYVNISSELKEGEESESSN